MCESSVQKCYFRPSKRMRSPRGGISREKRVDGRVQGEQRRRKQRWKLRGSTFEAGGESGVRVF